ncbi:MAG: arylsulfatase [Verrucomicrobiales bacterium]|nr:arylsulfatase [Verrucomicrobiales bacterium]
MKKLFPLTRLLCLFFFQVALCAFVSAADSEGPKKKGADPLRPNIILILADDLGFSDLGCYGGEIDTPNLDRLAAGGMRSTQFYNCGVCRTTRATLLTGVHPRRRNRGRLLHPEMLTIAEVLKTAGYQTSLTGKWHFPQNDIGFPVYRPTDRGFDEYFGIANGCCNYFDPAKAFPDFDKGVPPLPFLQNENQLTEFPDDFYATNAFTDHAIEQIDAFSAGAKTGEAPFFIHLSYTAPHYPLHAKPEDIAKYKGRYDAGYAAIRKARHKRLIDLGILDAAAKLSEADPQLGDFRYDYAMTAWEDVENPDREKRRMEVYAAMVDSMDQGIGKVMAALERNEVADNTLVIFLSDNGGCASHVGYSDEEQRREHAEYNQDLPGSVDTFDYVGPGWGWVQNSPFRRYKVWTYEAGIATPMIAHWPGQIDSGEITSAIGHVVDFMPTFAELSGAEYPGQRNGVDVLKPEGESFVSVLKGEDLPEAGYSRYHFWALYGNRAVRQGKWKMVWGTTARKWELYNLKVDRTETMDVIQKHPNQARRMEQAWLRWAKETGYPLKGNGL